MENFRWIYILIPFILPFIKNLFSWGIMVFYPSEGEKRVKGWWKKELHLKSFDYIFLSIGFSYINDYVNYMVVIFAIACLCFAFCFRPATDKKMETIQLIINYILIGLVFLAFFMFVGPNIPEEKKFWKGNTATVESADPDSPHETPAGAQPTDSKPGQSQQQPDDHQDAPPPPSAKDNLKILIYDGSGGLAKTTTQSAEDFQKYLTNEGYNNSKVERLSKDTLEKMGYTNGPPSRYLTFHDDIKGMNELTEVIEKRKVEQDIKTNSDEHRIVFFEDPKQPNTKIGKLYEFLKKELNDKYDIVVVIGLVDGKNKIEETEEH